MFSFTSGDRDMKRLIAVIFIMASFHSAAAVLNCEYAKADLTKGVGAPFIPGGKSKVEFDGKSFKAFRPGGNYVLSPQLTDRKNGLLYLDDKTKIFAAHPNSTEFAVSDRIAKTTEQWANCSVNDYEKEQDRTKLDIKEQMNRIASIPWGGVEANKFFLKETHLFMLMECGWAGSVGFSTGPKPLVMLGSSYYQGDKSSFKSGEYSITFNGGSMRVAYNPQKVSGYISDANSFTPCAAVRLGED